MKKISFLLYTGVEPVYQVMAVKRPCVMLPLSDTDLDTAYQDFAK